MALGDLLGVTIVAPDLDAAVAAYGDYLGYRGETGVVGADLAARWQAPGAEGCRMSTLWPASGTRRFVRFVESAVPDSYRSLVTTGWNSAEIVVADLAATEAALAGSPFRVLNPPAVLEFDFTDQISAMQVQGPAREVLYLTQVDGEVPGFDLPRAKAPVDSLFVAILATTRFDESVAWYAARAGKPVPDAFQATIKAISAAHGMAADHRHTLTAITLPGATLIEIDAFPPGTTTPRVRSACGLPAGIAIASFTTTELAEDGLVLEGPSGELIELLAASPP